MVCGIAVTVKVANVVVKGIQATRRPTATPKPHTGTHPSTNPRRCICVYQLGGSVVVVPSCTVHTAGLKGSHSFYVILRRRNRLDGGIL